MKNKLLRILLYGFIITSCNYDELITTSPQLVVEGWIDAGDHPVVILTTTVPVSKIDQEVATLEQYVVKWAKVTISDGEQEVVLTGKVDKDYFTQYIYTTSHIRGEAGKGYNLTISYKDFYAEARTTVPEHTKIDSISIEKTNVQNERYRLIAHFTDNPRQKNYYKFFTYTSSSPHQSYASAYQGLIADDFSDSILHVPVYRSKTTDIWEDYEELFTQGEKVRVKFAQMDSTSYEFWKSYEVMSSISRNPLFPATEDLKSNVQGALGYWIGYGADEVTVEIDNIH